MIHSRPTCRANSSSATRQRLEAPKHLQGRRHTDEHVPDRARKEDMKRFKGLFLAMLLTAGMAAAPLSVVTAQTAAPPALELVVTAMPLAAATAVEPAAQVDEAPPVPSDPRLWFASPAALAAAVAVVVAFLKANVLKNLHDWRTIIVSAITTAGLTIVGRIAGWHELNLTDGFMLAVQAFGIASGGWALITQLFSRIFTGKSGAGATT